MRRFLLLAYAYSWLIGVPLALQAHGWLPVFVPYWLHYATAFGPALAAFTVTRARPRLVIRAWWAAFAAVTPLAFFAVSRLAGWMMAKPVVEWSDLGRVNFLTTPLGIWASLLWLGTSGFGEESGWRGYALPQLQRKHSALRSSLLLGLAWAGWHAPAFFYVPSYQAMGLAIIPGFLVGILAGSIVLTWLFNSSGGSLLAVMLWHASFNFVTSSPAAGGFSAAFISTAVILWAIAIVLCCEHQTLTWRSVHAATHERTARLPADSIIQNASGSLTHAITIRATPAEVWPWLVQMGAGRAGWYSYDFLDNRGHRSAETIEPALQQPLLDSVFPALPGTNDGFVLIQYDPMRHLVLGWPDKQGQHIVTWAFVLRAEGPNRTRLVTRARGSAAYRFHGLPSFLGLPLARMVHFVMERKQLIGIANRVEQSGGGHARLERAS